ncbi:hypothetical protein SAMN05192563_10187 [Paraburkholderia aspalathi]|uniref:DUF4160 domain-containing protein n=2 Tax=Paraburkholderia aspalathi TaxID=1324617 RepID=A0A1I7EED9_9BURK|nr:hypothetical protein SAMN05192563_10187 [Paraburkholderia aspalathi]
MKVAEYNGMRIAVFTRDEHCPPHVHVDGKDWSARFQFSFWHNGVSFWDASCGGLSGKLVIEISATIKAVLPAVRDAWMDAVKGICLENRYWNLTREVVEPLGKKGHFGARQILGGTYDSATRRTTLTVFGIGEFGIQL